MPRTPTSAIDVAVNLLESGIITRDQINEFMSTPVDPQPVAVSTNYYPSLGDIHEIFREHYAETVQTIIPAPPIGYARPRRTEGTTTLTIHDGVAQLSPSGRIGWGEISAGFDTAFVLGDRIVPATRRFDGRDWDTGKVYVVTCVYNSYVGFNLGNDQYGEYPMHRFKLADKETPLNLPDWF